MNIFLHELKAYRKSTIIWACAMAAIAIVYLSIFPAFSKDVSDFKKILEGYPLGVRKALGISIDSITSLIGFYSFIVGYIILCGAIQAMNIGTSIVSKEVREKTADFLLTKPVSRAEILTAKLLSALASLLITNVIYIIVAIITIAATNSGKYSMKIFLLISFTLFFVQVMFMCLGIIISVSMHKIKSVLPISLGIVFFFFIISMFGSVIGENSVRYITPFKYYDPSYIIKNSGYEVQFVLIEIVFIIVTIIASYIIYSKKDIHTV